MEKLFSYDDSIPYEPRFSGSEYDFLNCSSLDEITKLRETLESWYKSYPAKSREEFRARFQSREDYHHQAAFFELLLHQVLLRHKYKPAVHFANASYAKTPDFFVLTEKNQSVYLEATIATFHSRAQMAGDARKNQLYDGLNEHIISPNFFISVKASEDPRAPVPIRRLAFLLNRELRKYDPDVVERLRKEGAGLPGFRYRSPEWNAQFEFFPKSQKTRGDNSIRPLGMFSSGFKKANNRLPLRKAIDKKGTRYGKFNGPFVVAVNALEVIDEIDVVEALFGREQFFINWDGSLGDGNEEVTMVRETDGIWTSSSGPKNRRISAVIVGRRLRPWSLSGADLKVYHNPWAFYPIESFLGRLSSAKVQNDRIVHTEREKLVTILGC